MSFSRTTFVTDVAIILRQLNEPQQFAMEFQRLFPPALKVVVEATHQISQIGYAFPLEAPRLESWGQIIQCIDRSYSTLYRFQDTGFKFLGWAERPVLHGPSSLPEFLGAIQRMAPSPKLHTDLANGLAALLESITKLDGKVDEKLNRLLAELRLAASLLLALQQLVCGAEARLRAVHFLSWQSSGT